MADLAEKQTYRFENVEVDTARGCLVRDGEERHLRQKTFQVLVYLLERRERLVPKNELIDTIWKDTAVTDDVLVQCIKEIRRAVGDNPHNARFIKTVSKAGYRFIGDVVEPTNGFGYSGHSIKQTEEITRFELEIEEEPAPRRVDVEARKIPGRVPLHALSPRARVFAGAAILLALAGAAFLLFSRSNQTQNAAMLLPNVSGKKAVVVMYFENQSGDTESDWLREGLADMLIADLSRSEKLAVLSRGQLHLLLERSGYYSDNKIQLDEALEIAGKSRAESIITGSFARIGEKIRIDVSSLDAQTGQIQASESLIVERAEQILTEIDLLSLKLLAHLGAEGRDTPPRLGEAMTENLEAYRFYSLGVEKAQAYENAVAVELLEKAVALDPRFALAHARIGYAYAVSWGRIAEGKPHLEKAFELSERLTEKDRLNILAWYSIANRDFANAIEYYRQIISKYPFETEAYWRLAKLLRGEGQAEEAVQILRQGLIVDADSKEIYNVLGSILSTLGRHDEAIFAHRRYVELAPNEPNAYDSLAASLAWSGNYDEAINNYNRALELKPDFEIALVHLANARFQLGQYREAIRLFERFIAIASSDTERARGFSSIAAVYLAKRDFNAAEQAANKAVKLHKSSIGWLFLTKLERGDASAKNLEALALAPIEITGRGERTKQRFDFYLRAMSALKNNRHEEAVADFRELLKQLPPTWNFTTFEDSLASALLELNRYDEAIAEYERILRLNPNYPLARFHLARAFEQKGMTTEARNSYEMFLQIWKDSDADIPQVIAARQYLGNV